MLAWTTTDEGQRDSPILWRIAQTLALAAADLLVWAIALALGYAGFFGLGLVRAVLSREPATGAVLLLFEVVFYAVYILAPFVAMVATYGLSYSARLAGARQATVLAFVIIALISLPLLTVLSISNGCGLGLGFPFEVHCGSD